MTVPYPRCYTQFELVEDPVLPGHAVNLRTLDGRTKGGVAAVVTGDGATTAFAVLHELDTRNVAVTVWETGTNGDPDTLVIAGVNIVDADTVEVTLEPAPEAGAGFRVCVAALPDAAP